MKIRPVRIDGRTDRDDEARSRLSQVSERAYKPLTERRDLQTFDTRYEPSDSPQKDVPYGGP